MPRKARIVLPGHLHHITQRGNHKQTIFQENQDRAVYLEYINDYCQKHRVDIFAL